MIGANRYFDVILGFVLSIAALGITCYYFKGTVYRQLMRTEQSFAVEVILTLWTLSFMHTSLFASKQMQRRFSTYETNRLVCLY